ncbi:RNA exonuclease 1 homolog [Lampris incognitus]|uniref:RNA exonuclease 1 homolog n=1 Tax=Lampris incognitus TaxID=2546036 RepID=UPI0024B50D10|nr:RNA exonuclease 1 homolog [Lampris incognitus]
MADTSYKSSVVDYAGVQRGRHPAARGAVVDAGEANYQLEYINKAIDTVKNEMEKEQKRLTHYQTAQPDGTNVAKCEITTTSSNIVKRDHYRPSSRPHSTKPYPATGKYVVDYSKPTTDLEYDPLSNFSADLGNCCSSNKDQKFKCDGEGLKKSRDAVCDVSVKSVAEEAGLGPPSPELLVDFKEEVIISPSPDKKRGQAQKPADPDAINPWDIVGKLEIECAPIFPDLPANAEVFRVKSPVKVSVQARKADAKYATENAEEPSCVSVNKKYGNKPIHVCEFDDLSKCLEDLRSESQKMPCSKATDPVVKRSSDKILGILPKGSQSPQDPFTKHREEEESPIHVVINPPPVKASNQEANIIDSSSDEAEAIYSDVDLSDSDPMEECYRIFMEAKAEENGATEKTTMPVSMLQFCSHCSIVKPQTLPGQKRVSHVAKYTELAAKRRPQPMVLVPLQGASAIQPSVPSKIQQLQQRASILTTIGNGGQAFVSSTSGRRPETEAPPLLPNSQSTANKPAPLRNACLPMGTTVLQLEHNLHLVIPEGPFTMAATSMASPVVSFLTPITPVNARSFTPGNTHRPATVTPVHRFHPTSPTATFTPRYTSSFNSGTLSTHTRRATPSSLRAAAQVFAKPLPTKHKVRQRHEGVKEKIPQDIRQRYVNHFTEELLRTSANVKEAFAKALTEEKAVYNRSVNKLKYLIIAVNVLKRLKKQSTVATKGQSVTCVQRSKGRILLNTILLWGGGVLSFSLPGDAALYESLKQYILTEEKLIENNYPLQHPEKLGSAVRFLHDKKSTTDSLKRICCRCGTTFAVSHSGKHTRKQECNYHYGRGVEKKVPGGVETRYSCCEAVMGAPGCQFFKLHVHDAMGMDGFVSTLPRDELDGNCPGVYALDCEMCYTTEGLEMSRVTVVSSSLQVIYDTFVRHDEEVIDYNTRFSGIGEEDVKGTNTSITEVQQTLLSFISADTILIGHGLERDLCALKLLHRTVVDTSVVFPHCLGPPHKLTLNKLTAEYLRRIIQESVCGHDTAEDATACMELMLWKVKDGGKIKK